MENPDLATDVFTGSKKTIYGTIAAILAARQKNASGAVTLLSCDNVRSNGDRFRAGLARFLIARSDGDLLKWMNENTTCPNSMVDRITPTPTSCIRERVLEGSVKLASCDV
jgi:D-arabinitol 4-dehydrogenase